MRICLSALVKLARRTSCGFICATAFILPALALNPAYQISQYAHSSWGPDAGIGAVRRIKQTPDGYLWLATRVGLVRFDGVRFTTFKAGSEGGLASNTTQDLVIDPDGSLWIATLGGGIAHYQRGKFQAYTVKDGLPSDEIGCLYRDSRGTLWVGTRGAGIARMVGSHFEKLPLAIPPGPITSFLEGQDHSLWIATFGYGVFRLQNGILKSFTTKEGLPDNRVDALYRDHAGRMWTAGWNGVSFWDGTRFVAHPEVNAVVRYAISCTEDRDGSLWIASSSGLFRAHGKEVSRMDSDIGLSGNFVSDVFEDREGNLWAGTRAGLDRFRDGPVRLFRQEAGSIVDDHRGVWSASNRWITRFADNTIRTWPLSLPRGTTAFALLSEPGVGLLIGFDNGVKSWTSEHTQLVPELSGLNVRCLLRAHDGSIWIGTTNRGLLRWVPSAHSSSLTETGVSDRSIATLAEDRAGAVWAGSNFGGGLYRVSGGNVQHFGRDEGLQSIYALFADRKGDVWIGSAGGLSWFQDGHIRTLNSQQGLSVGQVLAIIDDSYDRLWFTGFAGISAVDKKSLAEWASGKRSRINPILYRNAQGLQVRTGSTVFPSAAQSADGHLWFSIADGMIEVTPPNPAASHAPEFPVPIEDVTVDNLSHSAIGPIRISAGARSIEVRYTALTLSNPETVKFRYRLEGFDKDWVDAETRRFAFYNNLKPGDYNFRVAASIDQEHWQESPALVLDQLPFFYQTIWFRSLCVLAFLTLFAALYQFRLRQVARQFNLRLEGRVGERTRIARELHDTLLQSFQGVLMKLHAITYIPDLPDAQQTLKSVIKEARQAISEGRDAVQGLRSSTLVTNDVAEALNLLGKELAAQSDGNRPEFSLDIEGTPRDLVPLLRDEVCRITGEALRNAFRHANARRIEVEIRYDQRQLRLRVRDNGKGIEAEVLKAGGRVGHYGFPSMHERAKLIGGRLTVWSELDSGTETELTIPASIAYAKSPTSHRSFFRARGA